MESRYTVQSMGTIMSHHAFGIKSDQCLKAICAEVTRLEQIFSRFITDSDVNRINRSAGFQPMPVSLETYNLLSISLGFSARNNGCFDITVGPLVDLWREAKKQYLPPEDRLITETISLCGYQDLLLNPTAYTAGLARKGQSIDLGGIGKGYAADRVLDVYRQYGITSACSNMGGHVVTKGSKPDGSPWQVGIQHPRKEDSLIGSVSVTGKSVVTSGDYQRYFKDGRGTRYHHILDPLTGHPADSDLVSVTVVSECSTTADALSTILFVAGMDRGLEILAGYTDTEVVCIDREMRVWVTPGLGSCFHAAEGVETLILSKEMVR